MHVPRLDCSVASLLKASAVELDVAAGDLARVEEAIIGVLRSGSAGADGRSLGAIQGIDTLTQTLSSLATFLELAARQIPDDMQLDASAPMVALRMLEMSQRVRAALTGEERATKGVNARSVELFGDAGQASLAD